MKTSLSRILFLSLRWCIAAGCDRNDRGDAEGQRIQPGVPSFESAGWGYVPLKIVKTHERRNPLEKPPWHVAGGDWAFLGCQLANDASARVLIGVTTRPEPKGEIPVAWGEGVLAVADADMDERRE